MSDTIYDTPETNCPKCGTKIDAASEINSMDFAPEPGDYSICFRCNAALVFNKELRLDLLSEKDIPETVKILQIRMSRAKMAMKARLN